MNKIEFQKDESSSSVEALSICMKKKKENMLEELGEESSVTSMS